MERKENRLPIFTERFRSLQGDRTNTEFADCFGPFTSNCRLLLQW